MAVTYSCSCSCALHNAPPPHTMPPMMEEPISRVPRPPGTRAIDKARAAAAAVPFRNDQCMAGPPSCSASDFKTPRLRRCPFDLTTINWNSSSRLGGGLDGYVWKVWFGADGPYALKVFWDAEPPKFSHYFAVQRECQNAALLQMMETAVQQAAAAATPIRLNANPKTKIEAKENLYNFSIEGRRLLSYSLDDSQIETIGSIPRIRKCYGWLQLSGEVLRDLPPEVRPLDYRTRKIHRTFSRDKEYIAVVYEYVEEGENPPDVVEEVDRFLWLAGFSHNGSPAARNWKSGVR